MLFFFSSRRRHTRYWRDWSSDVCSSDPNAFSVIDAIEPAVPGITVEVRVGVTDQLLLINETDAPVEVLDREGEPFLRVGPKVVEADYSCPDWYQTNSPLGIAEPPAPAKGPEWRVVARGSSWGW